VDGPIVSPALSLPFRAWWKSYSTCPPSTQSELLDTALENCRAQTQQMPGAPIPQSPLRPSGMRAYETPAWSHHLGSFFSRSQRRSPASASNRHTANDDASDCRLAFGIFASLAVQIMSQLVDGELMITNNILDQISDRDDSDQLACRSSPPCILPLLGRVGRTRLGSP
jgi:hypothetical protein